MFETEPANGCSVLLESDSVPLRVHSIWFDAGSGKQKLRSQPVGAGDSSVAESAKLQGDGRS